MAMTATITQVNYMRAGEPCYFILNVANSGAVQVNVNSIQPIVTNQFGSGIGMPVNIGIVTAPGIAPSLPVAGGPQFNVPVPASGNVNFTFPISFFGNLVPGLPTQPQATFMVTANIQTSDGSVFTPAPVLVTDLNMAVFGVAGSNYNNLIAPLPGQLVFTTLTNTGLGLSLGL